MSFHQPFFIKIYVLQWLISSEKFTYQTEVPKNRKHLHVFIFHIKYFHLDIYLSINQKSYILFQTVNGWVTPRNSATFASKVIGFLCVSHRVISGDKQGIIKLSKTINYCNVWKVLSWNDIMAFLIKKNRFERCGIYKIFLCLCSSCALLEILLIVLLIVQQIYRVQEPWRRRRLRHKDERTANWNERFAETGGGKQKGFVESV